MAKKTKYLVDTSAVRPALAASTAAHCKHFQDETKDGSLWTSLYIRMEFIRCWICELARIAFTIEHFSDVEQAMFYLEQEFSQRQNKGDIACIGSFVKEIGPLRNCHAAAEEFASLAMRWLKKFDLVFASRITNLCKCQIGGKTPNVDYDNLLPDLHEFYKSFVTPVTDCEVNAFLQIGVAKGRAEALLSDPLALKLTAVENLAKLKQKEIWITCPDCAKIGDVIISLEQPGSWSLAHVDKSFNDLCRVLKRNNKEIKSVRAFDKELQAILRPKKDS